MAILALLAVAAFLAGAINSMAGGGSFLTFPSLVFAGLPAVGANASSTVALVPGALTSSFSYRDDIQKLAGHRIKTWFVVSLMGGLIGAMLLLHTSDRFFRQLAPWLLLFATLLFGFGNRISLAMRGKLHFNQTLMLLLLFPISIYGGYFGGGIGIMMLAAFRVYGLTDIYAMNGIKTLLNSGLNAVASVLFILGHHVFWRQTILMMIAAILGGYAGPKLAKRMPQSTIRQMVICVGIVMTAYFFRTAPR